MIQYIPSNPSPPSISSRRDASNLLRASSFRENASDGPYGVTLPTLNETNMAQAPPRGHMYLRTRHPNIAVSRRKLGRGHVWPRNCGIGSPLASDPGSIFRARATRLLCFRSADRWYFCCRVALPWLRGSAWWWSRKISGTCWSSGCDVDGGKLRSGIKTWDGAADQQESHKSSSRDQSQLAYFQSGSCRNWWPLIDACK